MFRDLVIIKFFIIRKAKELTCKYPETPAMNETHNAETCNQSNPHSNRTKIELEPQQVGYGQTYTVVRQKVCQKRDFSIL